VTRSFGKLTGKGRGNARNRSGRYQQGEYRELAIGLFRKKKSSLKPGKRKKKTTTKITKRRISKNVKDWAEFWSERLCSRLWGGISPGKQEQESLVEKKAALQKDEGS